MRRLKTMLRWTAVWLPLFLIAWLLEAPVYGAVLDKGAHSKDFVQVLRQMGYLPTWVIAAVLLWLLDWKRPEIPRGLVSPGPVRPWHHRGGLLLLSAVGAGIVANILKPVIGRLRPDGEGITRFAERPAVLWAEGGHVGLGLPSGHTSVAFGACGMLALLIPSWRRPMMLLATGCAYSRLLAGAHSLSDTVAGAWVGLAVAAWLFSLGKGPRRGPAGGLIPRES